MAAEKYAGLSPEERQMMEEATVEATEKEKSEAEYTELQQKVIDAFEAVANKSEDYKKIVNRIKEGGIFEGRGDAYEQILSSLKSLETAGASLEDIEEALKKRVEKLVERYSEARPAA